MIEPLKMINKTSKRIGSFFFLVWIDSFAFLMNQSTFQDESISFSTAVFSSATPATSSSDPVIPSGGSFWLSRISFLGGGHVLSSPRTARASGLIPPRSSLDGLVRQRLPLDYSRARGSGDDLVFISFGPFGRHLLYVRSP